MGDTEHWITFHDIYFLTLRAMAYCALGRMDAAKRHLMSTLEMALPLGIVTPFAESLTALGGLLEKCLEQRFPEYYGTVIKQWERTFTNWITFHNQFTKNNITLILSMRDYQIAQLAAKGVPYKKIAEQFHISVGRLKTIMYELYGKLFIHSRDELSQYIL